VVGGLYEVRAAREGDRTVVYPDSLRYNGMSVIENLATIQAQALRWEVERTSKSLERRTPRLKEIDDAIAPVVRLASSMVGYANREAIARYVAAKIHGA
jgi:hypothetical protein